MYVDRRWSFHKDDTFGAVARRYRSMPTDISTGTYSIHFCCDRYNPLSLKSLEQQHRYARSRPAIQCEISELAQSPTHCTIVILPISQQGRSSQLPVWNEMWRGAAWDDPRFDSIVYCRWLQGRNEEYMPYSSQLVTYRCRCLGINTATCRHESHRAYLIPCTVFRKKMSNELSFTQMTQTLSLYECTTHQRCWEICRNCLCGFAPHDRAIIMSTNPWDCGCTWSQNQPRIALHP